MSQLGVFLARQELRVVFDNFDQNKDGNIAYAEFVNVLKVSSLSSAIKHHSEVLRVSEEGQLGCELIWNH